MTSAHLKVVGVVAAVLALIIGLYAIFGDRDGSDETAERQRDEALAERDVAREIADRQGVEILELRMRRVDDSLYRIETARRDQQIIAAYNRLSVTVAGIVQLLPEPGTGDTAEIVGPRTHTLIVELRAQNARKDTTIARKDTTEKRLLFVADSLNLAFWKLDSAFTKLDSAATFWRGNQYSWWKDGLGVGPTYGAHECPPGSEKSICKGWGFSVTYTTVRPVRLVTEQIPRWVRRIL